MKSWLKTIFHPTPEPERLDTGLRYTDILFGFVTRELFIRLQNCVHADWAVRLQLIAGSTLVLGSWIGYRRSLHRSGYQLKFFNLPLLRFLADQCMLVLYFRIAVLTPAPDINKLVTAAPDLASHTIVLVICIFALYSVWDLLGVWMTKARATDPDGRKKPLYPAVKDSTVTEKAHPSNWRGFGITISCLGFFAVLWLLTRYFGPNVLFVATTGALLIYRWAKEVRTTWELPRRP